MVIEKNNKDRFSTRFLRMVCFSWGFLGLQLCQVGVLRATGNTVLPMVLALISQWLLQFPMAYVFSHYTSMAAGGIWIAISLSTVLTTLITLGAYAKGDWKKKHLIRMDQKRIVEAENAI